MFLVPEKTYQFNKENINYLFDMTKKEKAAFKFKKFINKEIENIDFSDIQNQRIFISFSICVALISLSHPVFAFGTGLEWADNIGNTFLHYAQAVGAWVCIIKAIIALIQAVAQDNFSRCWKNILGYAIASLAIYKIPGIFFSLK